MGGVDLMDSYIGRYRNKIKSKKWYMRLFFHLLDMTLVNSWVLFKRAKGKTITLLEFKKEVCEALCKIEDKTQSKRKSKEIEDLYEAKKKRGPTAPIPVKDVRQDGINHWPQYIESRKSCKMPGCKKLTSVVCTKCDISLCFLKDRECFVEFHKK